jgi:hypothetical protein
VKRAATVGLIILFGTGACAQIAPAAGTGPSSDKLTGLNPLRAVQQAYDLLSNETYRADITQNYNYDTSSLAPESRAFVKVSVPTSQKSSGREAVENVRRFKLTLDSDRRWYLVAYDGAVFVSVDDVTYKEAPFLFAWGDQFTVIQTPQFAQHLQGLSDLGKTSEGGATLEDYRGSVTADYLLQLIKTRLIADSIAAAGRSNATSFNTSYTTAVTSPEASIEVFIDRHSGQVIREVFFLAFAIDIGKLVRAAGQSTPSSLGLLRVNEYITLTFSGQGKVIALKRPASAGRLTLADLYRLLNP